MTERIVALLEQMWKETPHTASCDTTATYSGGFVGELYDNDVGHVKAACDCDWAQRVRDKIARATYEGICGAAHGTLDVKAGIAAFETELLGLGGLSERNP